MLQKWFFNLEAYRKEKPKTETFQTTIQEPTIEIGFIDKLMEMYKYRIILRDLKQDIDSKDGLSSGYVRTEGKYIVDNMLIFRSTYVDNLLAPRIKEVDATIQRIANKARFENYVAIYNALRCQCEFEYDEFMNVKIWKDILEHHCDRTHSQYGIIAIIRASMVVVNKEIWKAFLDVRTKYIQKEANKKRKREISEELSFFKKQLSAREQTKILVGEEFARKWESLPPDVKQKLLAETSSKKEGSKSDVAMIQTDGNNSYFSMGTSTPIRKNIPIKPIIPDFSTSATASHAQSQGTPQEPFNPKSFKQAKKMADNAQQNVPIKKPSGFKPSNINAKKPTDYIQQKQFYENQKPSTPGRSGRTAVRPPGDLDPYSPDIAPMNIFENQIIPIGIHNLSKSFRPNLATVRVLSLGMKFIPKTDSLKWKNVFSKFEDFRRRMNNKMFFFTEKTPGTFIRDKHFRIKNYWSCPSEYQNVNNFCYNVRDWLDELFQNTLGTKRSQNMTNKEKTALRLLHRNKNVKVVVNDTDKNIGPSYADKTDVITECRRQLYDKEVYKQLTQEEAEQLI